MNRLISIILTRAGKSWLGSAGVNDSNQARGWGAINGKEIRDEPKVVRMICTMIIPTSSTSDSQVGRLSLFVYARGFGNIRAGFVEARIIFLCINIYESGCKISAPTKRFILLTKSKRFEANIDPR